MTSPGVFCTHNTFDIVVFSRIKCVVDMGGGVIWGPPPLRTFFLENVENRVILNKIKIMEMHCHEGQGL